MNINKMTWQGEIVTRLCDIEGALGKEQGTLRRVLSSLTDSGALKKGRDYSRPAGPGVVNALRAENPGVELSSKTPYLLKERAVRKIINQIGTTEDRRILREVFVPYFSGELRAPEIGLEKEDINLGIKADELQILVETVAEEAARKVFAELFPRINKLETALRQKELVSELEAKASTYGYRQDLAPGEVWRKFTAAYQAKFEDNVYKMAQEYAQQNGREWMKVSEFLGKTGRAAQGIKIIDEMLQAA